MADSLAKMPCDTLSERARKIVVFFFSSSRRHTRWTGDWSSDVCSSDLAGVAVQPMNDAGSIVAVEQAHLAEAKLQGVDQRAAPVALGRVYDHVEGLVDDRQALVFVKHVERNVLGDGQRMIRLGRRNANMIA